MNPKKEQPAWYAVHTYPRAEKKVCEKLQAKGIEVYLPLQKQLRQWSDRKKWVEMPLIPSYLFVFTPASQLHSVVQVYGITRVIYFEGKPVPIPNEQIEWLKKMLLHNIPVEITQEELAPGDKVIVSGGHLMGMIGELVSYKSERRVVVRLEKLDYNLLVTIDINFLQLFSG